MIKNICIGVLTLMVIVLAYALVGFGIGEKVTEVKKEDFRKNPAWTTYTSRELGIELSYPKYLEVSEKNRQLTLKDTNNELTISRQVNVSVNDLIIWTPLTHIISDWSSPIATTTHIVINYEKEKLADPIINVRHLIIKNYPTSSADPGTGKDVIIVDTVTNDPATFDIIDTITFIK